MTDPQTPSTPLPDHIEEALAALTDPTTAPALAAALGYEDKASVTRACRDGRIPGAFRVGRPWIIPLDSVRQALADGTIKPNHKRKES